MLQAWLVQLDERAAALEAEEAATPRLSPDDIARIGELGPTELKKQRRLSGIALRLLIAAMVGHDRYDRVPFRRSATGKPELPGAPLSFSISHAAGRALIAVSTGPRVGIDLECHRPLHMSAARRMAIIHAADQLAANTTLQTSASAMIRSHDEEAADASRTLRAWVRLEAFAKAQGSGIGRVLTAAGVVGAVQRDPLRTPRPAPMAADDAAPAGPSAASWNDALQDGNLTIAELEVPPDPDGKSWYAAIAADPESLGQQSAGPLLRHLPPAWSSARELLYSGS